MTNKPTNGPVPATETRKDESNARCYYIRDPRQQSAVNGKPDGGWLVTPPTPARWVSRREMAQAYTAEEIERMKKDFPYLEGCDLVLAGK